MVAPVVQFDPGVDLPAAVAALIKATEKVEIERWIELSAAVLRSYSCPGARIPERSYVLDRKKGTWYPVDFEDEQFGGYRLAQLESLLNDWKFLDLIERPGLWRTGSPCVVLPGAAPAAAV